jgi:hypothetical protein
MTNFDKTCNLILSNIKEYILEMADVLVAPERWLVSVKNEQDVQRMERKGGRHKEPESPFIKNYLQRSDVDSSYLAGGKYFDIETGEVLNGKMYEKGYVDTNKGPKLNVENEMEEDFPSKKGSMVMVNLLNPKIFRWKWVDEENEKKNIRMKTRKGEGVLIAPQPIISIEKAKTHIYATRVEFKNPLILKNYVNGGEPRLRPTSFGSLNVSNTLHGKCYIYSGKKIHPVYELVEIV